MKTKLDQVIEAIQETPNGKAAKAASHWLALNVMDDKVIEYVSDTICVFGKAASYSKYLKLDTATGLWNPFTDANHRYELIRKVLTETDDNEDYWALWAETDDRHIQLPLKPYGNFDEPEDKTHDACQVLRKCYAEEQLTDDELERWC